MEQVANWQIAFLLITVAVATALSIYAATVSEGKGKVLCDDCRFNNDVDCLKADRPNAIICTAYRPVVETSSAEQR
ncbi:MAG: hypothetical protein SGJ27_03180 [Candidatus Melainabacteria bacterium]|nr:hypothetical protein [Candidatus Melainabacteria bacterium]